MDFIDMKQKLIGSFWHLLFDLIVCRKNSDQGTSAISERDVACEFRKPLHMYYRSDRLFYS